MKQIETKAAAEALLRELPSVIGAYVHEDVNGHPREVHLLIGPGPSVRHLARDVRDLLEERLGVPIDQRVISIAQLEDARVATPAPAAMVELAADPVAHLTAHAVVEGAPTAAGPAAAQPVAAPPAAPGPAPVAEPAAAPTAALSGRPILESVACRAREGRVAVRVTLRVGDATFTGEVMEPEGEEARARAGAAAALDVLNQALGERIRFELEAAAIVRALGRDYVVVAALASAPQLGRRPLRLAGAHPAGDDAASAGTLAALKAVNRLVVGELARPRRR
jgi:hypothetical protein